MLLVPEQLLGLWKGCRAPVIIYLRVLINTPHVCNWACPGKTKSHCHRAWGEKCSENVSLKARSYQCRMLSFSKWAWEGHKEWELNDPNLPCSTVQSPVCNLFRRFSSKKRETESGRGIKESLLGAIKLLAYQEWKPKPLNNFIIIVVVAKIIIFIITPTGSSCHFSDGGFCKMYQLIKDRHLNGINAMPTESW